MIKQPLVKNVLENYTQSQESLQPSLKRFKPLPTLKETGHAINNTAQK